MDMITFGQITESIIRVLAADKIEAAWTAMIAAQGQLKTMKDWVKPWENKRPKSASRKKGAAEFLAKYATGF